MIYSGNTRYKLYVGSHAVKVAMRSQQGLAYETGSITLTESSRYITVSHSLGSTLIVGYICGRNVSGGVNGIAADVMWPKEWQTVAFSSSALKNGISINCNTRSTSTTSLYPALYSIAESKTTTSFRFASNAGTYPFQAGTYDYVLVAADKLVDGGLKYDFGTATIDASNNTIPNGTGATSRLLVFVQNESPIYGVNNVIGHAAMCDLNDISEMGYNSYTMFVMETRTSYATYSVGLSCPCVSVGNDSITLYARNGAFPLQSGTYHYYIIEIPEFE